MRETLGSSLVVGLSQGLLLSHVVVAAVAAAPRFCAFVCHVSICFCLLFSCLLPFAFLLLFLFSVFVLILQFSLCCYYPSVSSFFLLFCVVCGCCF